MELFVIDAPGWTAVGSVAGVSWFVEERPFVRMFWGHQHRDPARQYAIGGRNSHEGRLCDRRTETPWRNWRTLSRPGEQDVAFLRGFEGDILILGAGGKMGPSLARLCRRAADAARRLAA